MTTPSDEATGTHLGSSLGTDGVGGWGKTRNGAPPKPVGSKPGQAQSLQPTRGRGKDFKSPRRTLLLCGPAGGLRIREDTHSLVGELGRESGAPLAAH